LSKDESAPFDFVAPSLMIRQVGARAEFEDWIAPECREISQCIDRLMTIAGVKPRQVDCVFLTGGSSLVPAIRQIFTDRFDPASLHGGGEFTSVARGLALLRE
jgi:hypothetical chaperone protein